MNRVKEGEEGAELTLESMAERQENTRETRRGQEECGGKEAAVKPAMSINWTRDKAG